MLFFNFSIATMNQCVKNFYNMTGIFLKIHPTEVMVKAICIFQISGNVIPISIWVTSECSKVEALESATLHPAEMLGITDKKGTLDFGTDADFVLLDDDLNVLCTYIAGECAWSSEEAKNMKEKVIS